MKKFKPGHSYICCLYTPRTEILKITVLRRTENMLIADCEGIQKQLEINRHSNIEYVKPWGSYRGAPLIKASKESDYE